MKFISVVFHPLSIATHLTAILLYRAPELLPTIQSQIHLQFLLIIFLLTGVMPAITLLLLKSFKYISDIDLQNRNERIIPFLIILFYYGAACYLFQVKLEMDYIFNLVMISVTVLIFILLILTFRFKISIHAAAAWSAVGYLTGIITSRGLHLDWEFYLVVLMAGLISTSRLYLGHHSPKEIWSGTILGFCYSYILIAILL
ncbi:MAG: hypothetical protein HRT61_22790 [Ekhidna sp.]|nr:hypothetical protein [Ekhidna sp.]